MSETPNTVTTENKYEIFYGFGGRALRRIHPERLFKSGDSLFNVHGQGLWEMIGFHPKGVRVLTFPHNTAMDLSWDKVYGFCERVPEKDKSDDGAQDVGYHG